MAFKMAGFSPFTKLNDDEKVRKALNNWKSAEKRSEDYRINQLNDKGGSKDVFNKLDSVTKSKRKIYDNLKKNSNFEPNKIKK